MAFDPTQFGAVAVDEPPKQEAFDPTAHGAIPIEQKSRGIGDVVGDIVKGADLPSVPIDILKSLSPFIEAPRGIKQGLDILRGVPIPQAVPESQELVGIEKKPLQERLATGLDVAMQLAFAASGGRALLSDIAFGKPPPSARSTLSEVAGIAKPETPMAAAVEPVPGVEAPPVPEVRQGLPPWTTEEMQRRGLNPNRPLNDIDVQNPSVREAVLNDPTLTDQQKQNVLQTGDPNAIEPSNAQIQTGETPLRVEEGTGSEIPRTSDSDNVIREAQGTAESGEIPARQGIEAQPQEVATTVEPTEATTEAKPEIPPDAKATVQFKTDTGEYVSREMNAKEAEGIFTKEKSSYKALIDCLG